MKTLFILLSLCSCLVLGWGQVTIYNANFSTVGGFEHTSSTPPAAAPAAFDGGNYTLGYDATPSTDGSLNYFRSNGSKLESEDFGGAAYFETDLIDISNVSSFTISAAGNTVGSSVFNSSSEFFEWSYAVDGGPFISGFSTTADGSLDWTETIDPSTGSTLVVRFDFNINGGGDGFEVTSVEVEGIPTTATVGWDNTSSTVTETNNTQTINIPVTASNFSSNFTLAVGVSGGTAEPGDYSLNTPSLSFSGNGTQNVSLSINNDADTDDETIQLTLTETTSSGVAITPAVHTVNINDDETPAAPQVLITEILDASDIADNKLVEICNRGSSNTDITGWAIERYANGQTNSATASVNGTVVLSPGGCYAMEGFQSSIDPACDNGAGGSSAISGNGNDVYELVDDTGNRIDIYGEVGTDGTGEPWEYTNSLVTRNLGINNPTPVFILNQWTILNSANTIDATPCNDSPNSPLPISLYAFTATPKSNTIQLHWRTATELNNDYMVVEHSTDGRRYSEIGRVLGAGTTQAPQDYRFTHEAPAPGLNYYRLRQVDYDGQYEYHGPVTARFGQAAAELHVFPTVSHSELRVRYSGQLQSGAQLSVLGLQGQVQRSLAWDSKSRQRTTLNVSDLPAGLYLLRLQNGREVLSARFVKQ